MVNPDFATFRRSAARGNLVPVWKILPADLETPVSAYLKLARNEEFAFLLESVEGGDRIGRYTYVGAEPLEVLTAQGDEVEIREGDSVTRRRGHFFDVLKEEVGKFRAAGNDGLPPFSAGAVGYAGYDLVRQIEPRVPPFAEDDVRAPDAVFMFFTSVLVFDHVKHQVYAIANARIGETGDLGEAYRGAAREVEALEASLSVPVALPDRATNVGPLELRSNVGKEAFCAAVEKAREYIHAGDIFQVVLSQRLHMVPGVDPFQIYRALRMVNW